MDMRQRPMSDLKLAGKDRRCPGRKGFLHPGPGRWTLSRSYIPAYEEGEASAPNRRVSWSP